MDKNIGKKLDGRYEITELIGVGGMADVYKATDIVDNKIVAVKILKKEFCSFFVKKNVKKSAINARHRKLLSFEDGTKLGKTIGSIKNIFNSVCKFFGHIKV